MSIKDEKIRKFVYVETSFLNLMVIFYIWDEFWLCYYDFLFLLSVYKGFCLAKLKLLLVSEVGQVGQGILYQVCKV